MKPINNLDIRDHTKHTPADLEPFTQSKTSMFTLRGYFNRANETLEILNWVNAHMYDVRDYFYFQGE